MNQPHSDALVFFGATGDLAYKKIFPALQSMVKRGTLSVPVIGVAKAGWNLDQFKARAQDSLEKHGGLDPTAWEKLKSLLQYVDGDFSDSATFVAVRKALSEDPIESEARRAVDRESQKLDLPPPVSADGKVHLRSGGTISQKDWDDATRKVRESPVTRQPPPPAPF